MIQLPLLTHPQRKTKKGQNQSDFHHGVERPYRASRRMLAVQVIVVYEENHELSWWFAMVELRLGAHGLKAQ